MRLIDLSHPLYSGGPCFPGDPELSITEWMKVEDDEFDVSSIAMGSHQGTHVDALSHALKEGLTLDRMPLEWFCGEASVVYLEKHEGEEIGPTDLLDRTFGKRVLLDTGWGRRFGQPEFYESFPSLNLDACRLLVERGVKLLGLDMPTPSREYVEAHHILLGAGIVIVESLANLDQLPERFTFAAFPLRFVGGDGSPVRAVAFVD